MKSMSANAPIEFDLMSSLQMPLQLSQSSQRPVGLSQNNAEVEFMIRLLILQHCISQSAFKREFLKLQDSQSTHIFQMSGIMQISLEIVISFPAIIYKQPQYFLKQVKSLHLASPIFLNEREVPRLTYHFSTPNILQLPPPLNIPSYLDTLMSKLSPKYISNLEPCLIINIESLISIHKTRKQWSKNETFNRAF